MSGLVFLLLGSGVASAQKGLYLSANGGMAYQLFETQPALRLTGELKWMFLPYLGIALDGAMQSPPVRSHTFALSATVASTKPNETYSYYSCVDVTGYCHFSFVFQPIAIAKRDTPHLFTIKIGGGVAAVQGESWSFARTVKPHVQAENRYFYSEDFGITVGLEVGYSYQVFGPLYLGSHLGAVTEPDGLEFIYIYAGFTVGVRFGTPFKKAA